MLLSNANNVREALTEIPISDPRYPAEWKGLSSPPQTLYALGNLALLQGRKFAVVGSRTTPANALRLGGQICKALSSVFTLVTGTADGGDGAAIEGALAGSGNVICLLAGGFSALPQAQLPLLSKVAQRGLLLAYQPFETPVRSFSYEERNKLLAALSCGALVLGAGEKSGALITASYAQRQGKPIFALPYPPNSTSGVGCNALIKAGGTLTENERDIAAHYGIELQTERKKVALTPDEGKAYALLQEKLTLHAEELAQGTGIPVYKLRAALSALEIKGLIAALGGNRYTIV